MRKQVDWDVRVWNLTAGGQEGTQTRDQMLSYMKEHYPLEDGWEVVSVSTANVAAGAISVMVFVAKYEVVGVPA